MAKDIGNALQISQGSSLPTYRVNLATVTPVALCTDITNISLPSTATVALMVTKTSMTLIATAATNLDGFLYKRTTANTAGTPLTLTTTQQAFASGSAILMQMDSNDQASQATAVAYATVASVGTGGIVEANHISIPAAATGVSSVMPFIFDCTTRGSKPLIIRPGQSVSLGFNGQTIPAGAILYAFVEWVEVPLISLF